MNQAAVAADSPVVAEEGTAGGLAHGLAAEEDGLDGAELRAGGEIDIERAVVPRVLEEDGFLRQPVEPGPFSDGEAGGDAGVGAGRAVDALAGLGGEHHAGAGRGLGLPVDAVAAGQAAGGVDEHGLQALVMGVGQADLGAAILVERLQAGAAIDELGSDAALAAGALQAGQGCCGCHCDVHGWLIPLIRPSGTFSHEGRRRSRIAQSAPSPLMGEGGRSPDEGGAPLAEPPYTVKCRRTSGRARSLAGPEC